MSIKGQRKYYYAMPTKANGLKKKPKLPKKKCLGWNPVRGDCDRIFQPESLDHRLCDLCREYINRNNLGD